MRNWTINKHRQSQLIIHLNIIPEKLILSLLAWLLCPCGNVTVCIQRATQAVSFAQSSPLQTRSLLALKYVKDKDLLSGTEVQ